MTTLLTFSLVSATRPGWAKDGISKFECTYLDFTADGQRLWPLAAKRADVVSVLVTNWPAGFPADAVCQLLGEEASPLPDGRVPLYVCPECGDLGCGAITAAIDHEADAVVWHSLGWQYDYDPDVDYEPYQSIGPFRFAREPYVGLLRGLLADNARA